MSRLILVFSALLALVLFFEVDSSFAEEGHHTLGVEAGQVGLSSDPASNYGNALGGGGFFRYAASDFLEFELEYLTSKHTQNNLNLTQTAMAFTALWDLDTFDIFTPFLKGGAEFVGHQQDFSQGGVTATGVTSNGFGLDFGVGAAVTLGKNFMTGLDFTYHNIWDVYVTPAGIPQQKAISSYFTVLLQLGFVFGGK